MSKPMTAAQWRAQLAKWGVNASFRPGWEGRGRPADKGPFSDVKGVMIHHTGDDTQALSYVDGILTKGRKDLPGPLCHAATDMSGKTHIIATGRANHAGAGSPTVLNDVITEDWKGYDREATPGASTLDGNSRFYGNEVMYDGGQPMTAAAYADLIRWCAAICDFHGWTALSIIGHGEWTRAKWDPGHTDMAKLRRDVRDLLKRGPAKPPAPADVPWHRLATYNIKAPSLTTSGAHAWKLRRDDVVSVIADARADVACLQETGSGDDLAWLTRQLAAHDLRRAPGGRNWRHVFYGPRVTYHESGSFTTDPALDGDLKHATWMWGEIDRIHGLWCSVHFESEDGARADKVRPEQATDAIVELKKVAAWIKAEHGVVIPRENWFVAGDTNSLAWVTKRMKDKHRFLAATAVTRKWFNAKFASFNGWVKNRLGGSVDVIYVPEGRPVLAHNQIVNSVASDHNLQVAVIGKTPQEIAS